MSRPGLRLGRYRLVELLGAGGMAEAWRADDGRGGQVVIKRILPSHAGDAAARRMLLDEARLSLAMRHPAIVGALEIGDAAGEPFVVLELVDGRNLAQVIGAFARRGRPPPGFAAFVAASLCRGLAHAHGHGLVHRDVSPSNVMIGFDGAVKLLDFGVARLDSPERTRTAPGMVKGKRHFMAPEQLAGEEIDARADLFAVGVILWEALTGRRLDRDAPRAEPAVPPGLERICRRALEPDRERRHPDAAAMAEELEREAASLGGNAELVAAWMRHAFTADDPEQTAPTRQAPPDRVRRRRLVGAALLGLVALGAAAALAWRATRPTKPPPRPAVPAASPPPAAPPSPPPAATPSPPPRPAVPAASPPPAAPPSPPPAAPPSPRTRSPSPRTRSPSRPAAPAPSRPVPPPRHEPAAPHPRRHRSTSDEDPLARQKDLFDPF